MFRQTTLAQRPAAVRRALTATLAALATAPVVLSAAPAHAGPAAPDVPDTIAVEGAFKPFLVTHAVGFQVHTCRLGTDGKYSWVFDGPSAQLLDDRRHLVGTHYAGPSWMALDGSTVVGELVDKVAVSSSSIPWLLLHAKSATAGPGGERLAETEYVQRINTVGGVTPAAELCNATSVDRTRQTPYTADYVFWKPTGTAA